MKSKEVTYIFLAFIAILGWNAFLIQRDDKLFQAYYHQKAQIEAQNIIKSAYQTHKQD
jgi:hypothetical protein